MIEGYILEILLILVIFGISTILFSKAAGTLNPGKVNVISYIYYIFMLQTFAGTALILLGFDKHYTLGYLLKLYDYRSSCFWNCNYFTGIYFALGENVQSQHEETVSGVLKERNRM